MELGAVKPNVVMSAEPVEFRGKTSGDKVQKKRKEIVWLAIY